MNDRNKKKTTIIFFLLVLGGAVIGVCLSFGMFFAKDQFIVWIPQLYTALQKSSPWIFIAFCLFGLLLPYIALIRAKKRIQNWSGFDGETDDNFYEVTERYLHFSLGISYLDMIVIFILFPLLTIATLKRNCSFALFLLCTLFFFIFSVFWSFLQRKSVEQLRILNPEKKGDPLELHFKRKWLDSLDEQEKSAAYAAAYKAFSSLKVISYGFVIVLLLFTPFFNVGFLPFFCIGCMWLIPSAVYLREASKKYFKQ